MENVSLGSLQMDARAQGGSFHVLLTRYVCHSVWYRQEPISAPGIGFFGIFKL